MKFKNKFEPTRKRRERPHSSHKTPYLGQDPYNGVPVQCQFCSGQDFSPLYAPRRRLQRDHAHALPRPLPPLRPAPVGQLYRSQPRTLLQRETLADAIAPVDPSKRWIDFTKHADAPNPLHPAQTEEESHSGR